jgi:CRP-like cAMP-binding protein
LISTLRRLPLFTDLSESELAVVAERATRRRYDAGTVIFSEGEVCHELLIVEEGSVRLLKTAVNGRQQLIGIERPGSSLAEVPVFDAGRYTTTAEALSSTILVRVEAEHFRELCSQHPGVAVKFIKVLAHRLRHLDGLVEELSFSSVRGRLIAYLLRLAEERGRRNGRSAEFELNENNEELAARLGTVRELVSRNLGCLHGEGLIEMRRRMVTIPDMALLEKAAQTD